MKSGTREKLLSMRDRVLHQVGELRLEALQKTGGEASGGLSNLPLHPADLASRQYEEDLVISLVGNEEQLLDDIQAALERLEQGVYGKCEECHAPVGAERLEAVPYARYCVR